MSVISAMEISEQDQQQLVVQSSNRNDREYNILRSLSRYKVGDPMRKPDMIICDSKEAASGAMTKLRPKDCAFILRSGGLFTYALYEGPDERDPTAFSFQVDERGHFKVVPRKQFMDRVKVPALPLRSGSDSTALVPVASLGEAENDASISKVKENVAQLEEEEVHEEFSSSHYVPKTKRRTSAVGQRSLGNDLRDTMKSNNFSERMVVVKQQGTIGSEQNDVSSGHMPPQKICAFDPQRSKAREEGMMKKVSRGVSKDQATASTGSLTVSREEQLGHHHPNSKEKGGHIDVHPLSSHPARSSHHHIGSGAGTKMRTRGTLKSNNLSNSMLMVRLDEALRDQEASSRSGHHVPQINTHAVEPKNSKRSIHDKRCEKQVPPTEESMKTALLLTSKLQINDKAYVRRSNGSFTLATVVDKKSVSITFAVNDNGDTKTVDLMYAWRYVKLLKRPDREEEEVVNNVSSKVQARQNARAGVVETDKASDDDELDEEEELMILQSVKEFENGFNKLALDEGDKDHRRPAQRRGTVQALSNNSHRTHDSSIACHRRRSSVCSGSIGVGAPSYYDDDASSKKNGISAREAAAMVRDLDSGDSSADDNETVETANMTIKTSITRRFGSGGSAAVADAHDDATTGWELLDDSAQAPDVIITQVECRTEDGQVKTVPLYKEGMDVYYKKQNEAPVCAKILDVQFDGLIEPYYTIQLQDGREKQTDNDHILLEHNIVCSTGQGVKQQEDIYKIGMDVYYKRQNEKAISARILDVHVDGELEPYYTIQLEDGREKQTDNNHIALENDVMRITNQTAKADEVVMYKVGMDVYYIKQNESPVPARILDAHMDDDIEPYYTIQLEDGREKQTDNGHITLGHDINICTKIEDQ